MNAHDIITASPHFTPGEFPPKALANMDPGYARQLVAFRGALGAWIVPSPLTGAWFRFSGSPQSRHYAVGRLSDAGDFFPLCNPAKAVMLAIRFFGGVGFYLDTHLRGRERAMLHTDTRPEQVLWCRVNGEYIYSHREPARYFRHLWGAAK